ncbi:MAG TPA: ABC transporter ATP-binding protein [Thermomicrobiales bacterium]|nr:ABC transporter ATP-binding protein [Thermomicrobiales bacterium]
MTAASTPVVETRGLTKRYGPFLALDALDLAVGPGVVFGFIGPNGAGKTTAMRIIATLLDATSGDAWVAGHSVTREPMAVRRAIGYMPDSFGVYDNMKVWEYLDFFAATYGIERSRRLGLIDDLLALVDLSEKKDGYVEALSRGMKQRLCLARTLVHDPQLLILDEPASGLDPRARIELRALLRQLGALGKTVVVSSHILTELADICDEVGIIERGRLLAAGPVGDLLRQAQANRRVLVRLLPDAALGDDEVRARIGAIPGVLSLDVEPLPAARAALTAEAAEPAPAGGGRLVRVEFAGDDRALAGLLRELVARGLPVVSCAEETGDLEDVFMRVTKGLVA